MKPVRVVSTGAMVLATILCSGPLASQVAPAVEQSAAKPVDSLSHWQAIGLHAMPMEDGDSILVDAYHSLLPVGDTVHPRRWALHGSSWLLAQARHRKIRYAAVLFLWSQPGDSLLQKPPRASWVMRFAQDSLGCWFIARDTTPVSSCIAREDPHSPVREMQSRP